MDDATYRVYPYRWAVLFMIVFVPLSIPASWAIDRFGFRKAAGLGSVLMAAFAIVRAAGGPRL